MPGDAGRKITFAFTAFPNSLLDTVMPLLRDTEWRVLCVVVRRTVHFRQGSQAGRATWITRSQMLDATGRDSEAVSRAVDALVQRHLLSVCDEAGRPLDTPPSRRAARGQQLFALHPQLLRSLGLGGQSVPDGNKFSSNGRKIEHGSREGEAVKPNTLKEKAMKKQADSKSGSLWREAREVFDGGGAASGDTVSRGEQPSFTDWKQDALLSDFFALFQKCYGLRFGLPAPQAPLTASQADQLRQRWSEEGAEKIEELLDCFFTLDWLWLVKQNYSPGAFASSFNLLRLTYSKKGFRRPTSPRAPPRSAPPRG